jgi:hypothetical protein
VTRTYGELLSNAKEHPESADYTALRMAFTETDAYDPYTLDKSLANVMKEDQLEEAVETLAKSLDRNYVNIQTHITAVHLYRRLDVQPKIVYHQTWISGLIKSIFESGDGMTFDTAFVVIDTGEEYSLFGVLTALLRKQSLVEHNGHQFDVMNVVRRDQPKEMTLYFNIDIMWTWAHQNLLRKRSGKV